MANNPGKRIIQGGHAVPDATIRRRFVQGWNNFQGIYKPLMDAWWLYDNSGEIPLLIEQGHR